MTALKVGVIIQRDNNAGNNNLISKDMRFKRVLSIIINCRIQKNASLSSVLNLTTFSLYESTVCPVGNTSTGIAQLGFDNKYVHLYESTVRPVGNTSTGIAQFRFKVVDISRLNQPSYSSCYVTGPITCWNNLVVQHN